MDKTVYSTDPDWGKGKKTPQPEPVRLSFQRGAKGSGVTRVERLIMHPSLKDKLLSELKRRLACGGVIKDGSLEFQGDHRDVLERELLERGYKVKRIGG